MPVPARRVLALGPLFLLNPAALGAQAIITTRGPEFSEIGYQTVLEYVKESGAARNCSQRCR